MKLATLTIAAGAVLSLAACAEKAPPGPRDTGNMAYPAPLRQGSVSTTDPSARTPDTGNMAYPAPLRSGGVGTYSGGSNATIQGTGSPTSNGQMSFPTPLPQGQINTTRPRQ